MIYSMQDDGTDQGEHSNNILYLWDPLSQGWSPDSGGQDPESNSDYEMEEATFDQSPVYTPDRGTPYIEVSTKTNKDDADRLYDHYHFRVAKAEHRFRVIYDGRNIVVERGMDVPNFSNHIPRLRELLDAQGWLSIVEDHQSATIHLVREFYMNIHHWTGGSFKT